MKKVKIAFIVESMVYGGVEKSLIELLKVLDYEKLDVTLLLRNGTGAMQCQIDHRVRVKYWNDCTPRDTLMCHIKNMQPCKVFSDICYRIVCRLYRKTWQINGWFSAKCLPLIDDEVYDYAIAFHGTTPSVVAGTLYRIKSVRKLLWIHAYVFCPEKHLRWFDKEYCKFDRIYCVSHTMREVFSKQFPNAGKRTAIFHNILDEENILRLSECSPDSAMSGISLVTVGRLSAEKGQDLIPCTVRKLLDAGYPVNWYIIGDGYLKEKIEREVEHYHVQGHVFLLGAKKNPYPYIKNCFIYVQTSILEGWCLTTHEARILHKPSITTNIPVMYEQFHHGETGIIAEGITANALSESIAYLLDHPEIYERIQRNLELEENNYGEELQRFQDYLTNEQI